MWRGETRNGWNGQCKTQTDPNVFGAVCPRPSQQQNLASCNISFDSENASWKKHTATRQNKTKIERREKKWQEKRSDYLVIYYTYIIVRLGTNLCVCSKRVCMWFFVAIARSDCHFSWTERNSKKRRAAAAAEWREKIIQFQMYTFMFGFKCILFFLSFSISFLVSVRSVWFSSCPFLLCTRSDVARLSFFASHSHTFFISYVMLRHDSHSHSHSRFLLTPKVRSFKITPKHPHPNDYQRFSVVER